MPRQEFWTQENFARLDAHVILSSSGAALEYIAGAAPTPPRWAGRIGLEWIFRLAHEPRRLFSRYLIEPWYILLLLLVDYPRSLLGMMLRGARTSDLRRLERAIEPHPNARRLIYGIQAENRSPRLHQEAWRTGGGAVDSAQSRVGGCYGLT